jgi:peroxiredoxin
VDIHRLPLAHGVAAAYLDAREMDDPKGAVMELGAEMAAQAAERRKNRPAEITALFDRCIDEVRAAGVAERALAVGASAPDFTLPDATGVAVRLADLRAAGPVVISFYRGGWCPYCNLELRAYAERSPDFEAAGARVVAISPQTPDASLTLVERAELPFTVLSDVGNVVAASFGLVHPVQSELAAVYAKNGFDLAGDNAQDPSELSLPLPATYVVDRDGTVAFAAVSEDYTVRADPEAVLAAVVALG